eukprot:RCo026860
MFKWKLLAWAAGLCLVLVCWASHRAAVPEPTARPPVKESSRPSKRTAVRPSQPSPRHADVPVPAASATAPEGSPREVLPFTSPREVAQWLVALQGRYVVMRIRPTFPGYKLGEDVDVLTSLPPVAAAQHWFSPEFQRSHVREGWRLKATWYQHHYHVDLLTAGGAKPRIGFRFDLVSNLTKIYRRFHVHPSFSADVIRRAQVTIRHGELLWVPCSSDDRALRYMEYLEEVVKRPEKKKHLEAIAKLPAVAF